mmetsp:Transcript_15433/g.18560  ORF Transcript_15433/g.18560 Transcript_15433/m.18560 type:complete len:324 (+) Transcript_15433:19-990(+)
MAYNGIGLVTPRGSGTNGYVQRNLGALKPHQRGQQRKSFDDYRQPAVTKKPNKAILEHNRKRKIELKLLLLEEDLKSRGLSDEEIKKRVEKDRKYLRRRLTSGDDISSEKELKETHAVSFLKEKENEKLRRAFGIKSGHRNGESFKRMEEIPGEDEGSQVPKKPAPAFLDRGGEEEYNKRRRQRDSGRDRDRERSRDRGDRDNRRGRDRERRRRNDSRDRNEIQDRWRGRRDDSDDERRSRRRDRDRRDRDRNRDRSRDRSRRSRDRARDRDDRDHNSESRRESRRKDSKEERKRRDDDSDDSDDSSSSSDSGSSSSSSSGSD